MRFAAGEGAFRKLKRFELRAESSMVGEAERRLLRSRVWVAGGSPSAWTSAGSVIAAR